MLTSNKIWEFRQSNYNNDILSSIAQKFNISLITAKVILNRGLSSDSQINKFLYPKLSDFYDPFLMKDMSKAVDRIIEAVNKKEKIIIYGDYDVDGITSTSILMDYLKEYTSEVEFYIPDRIEEGYGLSLISVDKLIANKANLIITVDCGITAVEEINYIKKFGVDIIITDHHECKEELPDALAIVNPKQCDCSYPFKDLAGVGVVFKLIQALAIKMNNNNVIEKYIEIVALGTVADVVPLLDENRIIVKYGLSKLSGSSKVGIKSLINISGLGGKPITTTNVGYIIAPRINAAGRIGNARRGVELFLSEDAAEADKIAEELDQDNKNRQQTENLILNQALEMVNEMLEKEEQNILVLASEGWHNGVIGIVASRITEKFNKPSILISLDGQDGKGSGRSIPGFNIFEGLTSCKNLLEKFGGHELAVGLSIKRDKVDEFRKEINKYANEILSQDDFFPRVKIDSQISKEDLKNSLVKELKLLEPYGIGNPSPVFLYNDLKIIDFKTVGEDKHLKLRLEDNEYYIDSIGFNFGESASKINIFDKVDLACSIESNIWNGTEKIQLNIKDIRTNHEILFKEKYYSTLENSIFAELSIVSIDKQIADKIKIFDGNILSLIQNNLKNLILINTLMGAKNFIDMLGKMDAQGKGTIKLAYNNILDDKGIKNFAIINPYLKEINLSDYDNVIMYDLCFSKNQYYYLVKNSKNIYVMNDYDTHSDNLYVFEQIIPGRDELIKVYQFIKSKSSIVPLVGDISSLSRDVSISYNIDVNSLKLKKILEIFNEMKLIDVNIDGDIYSIKVLVQTGMKVNIQEAKGLIELIKIRDEFETFAQSLRQGIC